MHFQKQYCFPEISELVGCSRIVGTYSSVWCLVVKNLPANAGNAGGLGPIPRSRKPLEKEMATHSSILAWEIPDRGAWQATVYGVAKQLDTIQ